MPLSLIAQPTDIALARNPVLLQLKAAQSGGALYSASGVSAELAATATDRFGWGETITIEYTEPDGTVEEIVFTCAAAPDPDTIDEFPGSEWPDSDGAYWAEIARIIGAHPRIAPFFSVVARGIIGPVTITVTARDTGEGWELDMANTGGFTVTLDTDGIADSTPANYRVLVEVFFERTYRSGDYERVAQLTGTPDPATGYMYFDLSSVLAAQCRESRAEPLVPVWNTSAPAIADNVRRYYIRYTEEYGAPVVAQDWAYTAVKMAMDGGVSQAVHKESGAFGYLSTLDADDSLLTWVPDGRSIGPDSPEYLTWYNHSGATKSVALQVVVYDVDTGVAAAAEYAYTTDPVSVRACECCVFPVGVSKLEADLSGTFAADKYKFTVRVVDADTVDGDVVYLSESRTYFITRDYHEAARHVQYLNGFGVPETLRCTGEWSKRVEVQREVAERPLLPDYSQYASDTFQYGRTFAPVLVYRTGYVRKGEAEALQELLIAGHLYDVSADGYIPLLTTDNRFDVTSTYETLHTYQFATRPRLSMKNFSLKKLTQSGADGWEEPSGEFWFDALLVAWQTP